MVLIVPGKPDHVRRTPYDAMLDEDRAIECHILCHNLKLIECWWQKTRQMRSIGMDPTGGFAMERLNAAIQDGEHIADQYLRIGRENNA